MVLAQQSDESKDPKEDTTVHLAELFIEHAQVVRENELLREICCGNMDGTTWQTPLLSPRSTHRTQRISQSQSTLTFGQRQEMTEMLRRSEQLKRSELELLRQELDSKACLLASADSRLSGVELKLHETEELLSSVTNENERRKVENELLMQALESNATNIVGTTSLLPVRDSKFDCFCDYTSQDQAPKGLDDKSAAIQLTLIQDELEFTKKKLAKEIEMSINGRLERREVRPNSKCVHHCSLCLQTPDQKKLKFRPICETNSLFIASVIHEWSKLSAKSQAVTSVLSHISRGSCNTRVKQALQRVSKTIRCGSLTASMGQLEVITAAAFRLFAFRNGQQLFQVFAAWNSVLDEKKWMCRKSSNLKSTSTARQQTFRTKDVIHSWMLFCDRQKRKSMIFASMLLHAQHLMSQQAWNLWRSYAVAESRNFRIGVRTYEKYLLRLTRVAFFHWGLYYDQRIHIRFFSKQHCQKGHSELQHWVFSTWRFGREQHQSSSSPVVASPRSLHDENVRSTRNRHRGSVQMLAPALATQDVPCDPANDSRVAGVLQEPRRNLTILQESYNFMALQDSHDIAFSPHHKVLCSLHSQNLMSANLDHDGSKFLFLTKCEKESDFSILAGDSKSDSIVSCTCPRHNAINQERGFLPYRFRTLLSGFRSWNTKAIERNYFYRKDILFRRRFCSIQTKKMFRLWASGLRWIKLMAYKELKLKRYFSKKLIEIHVEKWLAWIRQSHDYDSKLFIKLPCIEQSLLVFGGESSFQNGDENFLKYTLDRIYESICPENSLSNENESCIYVVLGIERAGIKNFGALKQDLCRFVAESCNLQCDDVTVADIRGGKWTSMLVRLNLVGLHLSKTNMIDVLIDALRSNLFFANNDLKFRHLKIRCIGRVPALMTTRIDSIITVDPILNGHTFIVAHVRSAKGQFDTGDLAKILLIYVDELRTSVQISQDHILEKVKTITIRNLNQRVHRYLLKLQYFAFTSWITEMKNKYVRHFAKFLEGLKSRAYGAWYDKVLNNSWFVWKQRITSSRSKWSRRLPTRSFAVTDLRKDPANIHRINFLNETVRSVPLQILQNTQKAGLAPAALLQGHNAFEIDSLHENAFPKKWLVAAKSFNGWRSYVTCHEVPTNGVKALFKRCTTGKIQYTFSEWRRYWWSHDALKRKEIVLNGRYQMYALKIPFATWIFNSKLQNKISKLLFSTRFIVLDQMFGLWLQQLQSCKALICISFHKLRQKIVNKSLCLCFSAWIGHVVTLKMLKLTFLTICRRQCSSITLFYPVSRHVSITAPQYEAVVLFEIQRLQKQYFMTWKANSASSILLQKHQDTYLSKVRLQAFRAWLSLLSFNTVFVPNQCNRQLYLRMEKQRIIHFLELQLSKNLRRFIHIWSQASYLLEMKIFKQNRCTRDVSRNYCWNALTLWKQFCAGRALLVKQRCIDLLTNGLKCFFTWKVAAVHQRAQRESLTEIVNRTHHQYLRTALNGFVLLLKRKKRANLLCDRASCFAQASQKQKLLVGFLNIKFFYLAMKYPASIFLLKSLCSQVKSFQNAMHLSTRSGIMPMTDKYFGILRYQQLADSCSSVAFCSAVRVVFMEWKIFAKIRVQLQHISCHLVHKKVESLEASWAFNKWRLFFEKNYASVQVLSKFTRQREYAIKSMAVQQFFITSGLFMSTFKSLADLKSINTELAQSILSWTRLWKKIRSRPIHQRLISPVMRQSRKKMITYWVSFLRIQSDRMQLRGCWYTWKTYFSKSSYIAVVSGFLSRQRALLVLAAAIHGWKASCCKSIMSFHFLKDKSVKIFDISCRNTIKIFLRKLTCITLIANLQLHIKILRIKALEKLQNKAADILFSCFRVWSFLTNTEKDRTLNLPLFRLHDKLALCVIMAWRFQARSNRLLVVSGIRVLFSRKQNLCRLGIRKLQNAVIFRKCMMSLTSRLTRMRQRCVLSEVLDIWYDFLDECHSNSQFDSSCSRGDFQLNDSSLTLAQNGMKDINPCYLNHESPDLINDWNGYIKALKARDMIIEMQQSEAARLTALVEEKATAIYQREQSIAIRDKWLEQLSIESQAKDSLLSNR